MQTIQEMITVTECISMDFEESVKSDTIKQWFTDKGYTYDADSGVMTSSEGSFYVSIYSTVGSIFFREWDGEFPDDVLDFVLAHPCERVSLLTVDEQGYPDHDSASDYTHQEFVDLLMEDDEE